MKKILLLLTLAFTITANAQDDKTVTLTVSGQGKTQDEAKQVALRSAIEQAFGAFISSKTEILNDKLVKDEIVSVTNGNIQKYDVLSEVQIPDGGYSTTLKATVSVSKLTSFCENKGIVVEFKGNILALNLKQQMLNESNEITSMENLYHVCRELLNKSIDYNIKSEQPLVSNNNNKEVVFPLTIEANFNNNINLFRDYFLKTLKSISMTNPEVENYSQLDKTVYRIAIGRCPSFNAKNENVYYIRRGDFKNSKDEYDYSFRYWKNEIILQTENKKDFEKAKKKYPEFEGYKYSTIAKNCNVTYIFRKIESVAYIINLIYSTSHSIFNFNIQIGADTINGKKLEEKLPNIGYYYSSTLRNQDLRINSDNFAPILNSFSFPTIILENNDFSATGKIEDNFGRIDRNYYYDGGKEVRIDESAVIIRKRCDKLDENCLVKLQSEYAFLDLVNDNIPDDKKGCTRSRKNHLDFGYYAIISLLNFDNLLTPKFQIGYDYSTNIEKVQQINQLKILPAKE